MHEAAAAIREHGLGLKAATVTPETRDDVGSPNRILREEIGGKVIVRTGRRIPGVVPFGGVHAPISVVRMAVGDAYGAKEWREGEGDDEVAFRTERIERSASAAPSRSSRSARRSAPARRCSAARSTPSRPTYEGMLKEEMDAAAARHPGRPVRAAADRRDVRAAGRLDRRPARDPGAEPRRRHPLRPRAAALRLDRRLGVDARRVRGRRTSSRRR